MEKILSTKSCVRILIEQTRYKLNIDMNLNLSVNLVVKSYLCLNQGAYGLFGSAACVSDKEPSLALGLFWRKTSPYSWPADLGRLCDPISSRSRTDWLS